MRKLFAVVAVLLAAASVLAEDAAPSRFEKVLGRIVKAINEGDYAGVGNDLAQNMQDFLPLAKRTPFLQDLSAEYGRIKKVDQPRLVPPDHAVFVAHCERGKLDITLWLDDQDKVTGLLLLPHKPDLPFPERNATRLSLPFKGRWFVAWGGDTKELNQHHDVANQRFAFDFLGADEKGRTRADDSNANEDYFAFGREILSPADGTVTDVIRGVRDNVPGSMNPYSGLGNAVFVQHTEHEVSVLAHLKLGSIKVRVGDRVKKRQVIALCGNSGNSSEPHLHYHLQNTPVIQDGTGIKCYFEQMTVIEAGKRKSKPDYSPVKGEKVIAE
ncbi:MAG: peptidoglycan DD-metalloendopeptidase family protein [Phycisphaerales bacterium]|nr:MAG: peptidoglycan DD-metalloendopeptidase family protein [Phycisphaerales bacterium]